MKKPYPAIIRHQLNGLVMSVRIKYYRFLGLKILGNVKLGKIICNWPNRVSIGSNCEIDDGVYFKIGQPFSEVNQISVGNNVWIGANCQFTACTQIVIGDDCLIASNVTFVDIGHEMALGTIMKVQPCTYEKIILGDDVWIGTQCAILKGVTIGRGSIIGAGSVVNKSIPENQIWAGVPAKFIRFRK